MSLDHIDGFTVTLEDVEKLGGLAIPDEEIPVVGAGDDVFVVKTVEVDVFDGLDVAVAGVFLLFGYSWDILFYVSPELLTRSVGGCIAMVVIFFLRAVLCIRQHGLPSRLKNVS